MINNNKATALCYGAQHPLHKLTNTHIFIICPNNSGSTLLKKLLETSKHTWNLPREGQAMAGFKGIKTRGSESPLTWAADKQMLCKLQNPNNFDWEATRKQWYFQAYSQSPTASIFVEKSPSSLAYIDQLAQHFSNTQFVFMVRNPYAAIEGICRRLKNHMTLEQATTTATKHIIRCLQLQRNNIIKYQQQSCYFSYETLCDNAAHAKDVLKNLNSNLGDININTEFGIKQIQPKNITNMNQQQINRLGGQQLQMINLLLENHKELLLFFNYGIYDW